jgi:hypothetical protein
MGPSEKSRLDLWGWEAEQKDRGQKNDYLDLDL